MPWQQICPLEGTFVEKHDPAKPHILLNGDSTSKPLPTMLGPEDKTLKSTETIALESPAVAAGFLTGKHNLNRFTVADPNGQPVFRAHGDCNGCLLMPGASRETDILFVSLHDNPLEQFERYADLAGKINEAKIWPPRVAWCTWYAGWMHAKMATYKNGLEKGVEENIPYVKKYFASRGGNAHDADLRRLSAAWRLAQQDRTDSRRFRPAGPADLRCGDHPRRVVSHLLGLDRIGGLQEAPRVVCAEQGRFGLCARSLEEIARRNPRRNRTRLR